VVLPADGVIDGAAARRPTGLPTSTKLNPAGTPGHYTFDFPIQPDEGDKDTLFQITYHLPYTGSKYTFKPQLLMAADNFAVLMPKSMTFAAGPGEAFQPVNEDPGVQTYVAKNVAPGKPLDFTISGVGSIPREGQGQPASQPGEGGAQGGNPGSAPGGGIGTPINTPDALSQQTFLGLSLKVWIIAGLLIVLLVVAAFLLRKPPAAAGAVDAAAPVSPALPAAHGIPPSASPASKHSALLNALKEELFAVESERIAGTLPENEYAKVKAALEVVLKRALNKK